MSQPIRVGITQGDINGVGYEVILKSLAEEAMTELCTPIIFGFHSIAEKCRRQLGLEEMRLNKAASAADAPSGKISVVEVNAEEPELTPGEGTEASGKAAVDALKMAVEALKDGQIDVLVTAPISKEAVQSDEFKFPGHTEFLEESIGDGAKARMILCDDYVRVALVSTHLPVSQIAAAVTHDNVEEAILSLNESLKRDFGFERPRIAVLSLNPHAGDGGVLGNEEKDVIEPVIKEMREKGMLVFGPFAADGFFGLGDYRKFDGILAMYHDQGLAPFKTLAGANGVNFTAGLSYVRTSPDHGTAFGIAWKGIADETSMREAIYKALDIFRRRRNYAAATENPLKKYVNERPDRGERQERAQKKEKTARATKETPQAENTETEENTTPQTEES